MTTSAPSGIILWVLCCIAVLAAVQTDAQGARDSAVLHLIVVPDRTYVEPWFEQIGLNDRVSLHFVLLNDSLETVDLDSVRFSFQGARGCAYEVKLSRDALVQRLRECASAVFVAPEVSELRKLATESRVPPGGVVALIGSQFDIPAGIGVKEVTIAVRARGERGRDRSVATRVKLWRYETTTRFQFPFEGVWIVPNVHGPGMGHPVDSFAYDFLKVRGIGAYEGDGSKLEQWWGYGAPILAAADGVVVEANQAQGVPERAPFTPLPSAKELGIETEITNTLVTVDQHGASYRPGNLQWQNLSLEDRARVNGAYVVIRHGDEEFSFYAHLQPGSLAVKPGDRVKAGQTIGKCGSAGHANGPGLHFQVLYKPDMQAGLPVAFTPTGAPEMHLRLIAFGTYEN